MMEAAGEMFPIFFQVKQMVIVLDAFMLLHSHMRGSETEDLYTPFSDS